MEFENRPQTFPHPRKPFSSLFPITLIFTFLSFSLLIFLFLTQSSLSDISGLLSDKLQGLQVPTFLNYSTSNQNYESDALYSKLRASTTFLPLKDLRFSETPQDGNTWFMSSLNDTHVADQAEHLYFPSAVSEGRILCFKGRNRQDGTKNSYALAWSDALPEGATVLSGLTFVSDTYFDYENLWHALGATSPFVAWSLNNKCAKPARWLLFHWGELRPRMGFWVQSLMETYFGKVPVEGFENGEGPYCLERALVMRHNEGHMGKEKKLEVFDWLRCKARGFCGVSTTGKGLEVNENGQPTIRLTLLTRRGSRSFKNTSLVRDVFAKECAKVEGCLFKMFQSEDLSFCDQVTTLTFTDIVASSHGAQLTNMIFMDRRSSVMEFFPKGWKEHAGEGQFAHHWMADISGMRHEGAWWDPHADEDCPNPKQHLECFLFYKDGKVGQNETFFAGWARAVLNKVRLRKLEQATGSSEVVKLSNCSC